MTQLEVLEAIGTLNERIQKGYSETRNLFSFSTDGRMIVVYLGEVRLCNSENDDREENESTGEMEPMIDYLIRRAQSEVMGINSALTQAQNP